MEKLNLIFGIMNISCGILFILISIPLVSKKVPVNKVYGFHIAKAFSSDENWYEINWYGGKQLIQWSVLLIFIGVLYFIFPVQELPNVMQNVFLAVVPIILCVAITIWKTIIFAGSL
jgi:hypothetical protein